MKKNNQNGFGAMGFVAVAVIIGLVGLTGWLVHDRQKATENKSATNVTTKADSSKDSEVTTGYKKYVSTSYNYSFLYPDSWSIVERSTVNNPSEDVTVAPVGKEFPNILVLLNEGNNSSCEKTTATIKGPVTKVTVDNIESKQYLGGLQAENITTCVPHAGKIFEIVHGYAEKDYKAEYQKVLESFKFL